MFGRLFGVYPCLHLTGSLASMLLVILPTPKYYCESFKPDLVLGALFRGCHLHIGLKGNCDLSRARAVLARYGSLPFELGD